MSDQIPPNMPPKIITPALPTPTYGEGGSFTIICSRSISASPAQCLATVLDASSYPSWNTFVRRVNITFTPSSLPVLPAPVLDAVSLIPPGNHDDPGTSAARPGLSAGPGMRFEFEVHLDLTPSSSRIDPMEMTLLDDMERDGGRKGFRVAWKWLGLPGWVQRSERIQEFVEDGEEGGGTVYKCWETFYGIVALATRVAVGKKLEKAFAAWGDGLKREAEKRARGELGEAREGEGLETWG